MIAIFLGVALVAVTFAAIKFLVGNEKVFMNIVLLVTWILTIIYMPWLAVALGGIALLAAILRAVSRHAAGICLTLGGIVVVAILAPFVRWASARITAGVALGITMAIGVGCAALLAGIAWHNPVASARSKKTALMAENQRLREEQKLKLRASLQIALDEAAERLHRENEEAEHAEHLRKEMDEYERLRLKYAGKTATPEESADGELRELRKMAGLDE